MKRNDEVGLIDCGKGRIIQRVGGHQPPPKSEVKGSNKTKCKWKNAHCGFDCSRSSGTSDIKSALENAVALDMGGGCNEKAHFHKLGGIPRETPLGDH